MFKKTIATVRDGRLSVYSKDARLPGVSVWPLETVSAGTFELASQSDGATVLVFKGNGKKAPEMIAAYDDAGKAGRALESVYAALGGARRSGGGRLLGLAKIAGIILVVLFLFKVIFDWGSAAFTDEGAEAASVTAAPADQTLPVGKPFPVDDYVRAVGDNTQE